VTDLGRLTWPEIEIGRPLLLVPLGSCEQHGPHLPLDTDARIAVAVAERFARCRPAPRVAPPPPEEDGSPAPRSAVVAPVLAYGSSGEHAGFAGTLSIGQDALEHVLTELGRSADHFAGLVFINGHGGNLPSLQRAGRTLRAEGRRVLVWSPPAAHGDAHAGRTETSVLLALCPELVRVDRAEAGAKAPLADLLSVLRSGGVLAASANGVLGDPAGASATEGEQWLRWWVADLAAAVDAWIA